MKNIPITFRATFVERVKHFKVEIITPDKRWVELMTISKFLRWAQNVEDSDLKIGGIKVKMEGGMSAEARKQINDYFKSVAEAYKTSMGYYN